jgi:tRNA pseudouridine38-40 synthase
MRRFALIIAYDGYFFQGWQKQPLVRTVQGELEKVLSEIAKEKINTIGSSRTDAGVHALCQCVHFDFPINMTAEQVQLALNTKIPKDIEIVSVHHVDDEFHSRFDARERAYRYYITKKRTPFNRFFATYFPRFEINVKNITNTTPIFYGSNDFELFSLKNPELETFISEIRHCKFIEEEGGYVFEITANRFLHNMVRRIVGTLVRLSSYSNMQEIIYQLLKEKNREYHHLVYTAPPYGLFLTEVKYDENSSLYKK